MLFFNPTIIEYTEHDSFEPNDYTLIGIIGQMHLICPIKKVFWKIYTQSGREFKTWDQCIKEKQDVK